MWRAAGQRRVEVRPIGWPALAAAKKRVRDVLRDTGTSQDGALVAFESRRVLDTLEHLPVGPEVLDARLESLIEQAGALTSSPSTSVGQLAAALCAIRNEDNPLSAEVLAAARDASGGAVVILPPAVRAELEAAVRHALADLYVVSYALRRDVPVISTAIFTSGPNRYGAVGGTFDINNDHRGSWIAHAAPAPRVVILTHRPQELPAPGAFAFAPMAARPRLRITADEHHSERRDVDAEIARLVAGRPLALPAQVQGAQLVPASRLRFTDGTHMYVARSESATRLMAFTNGQLRYLSPSDLEVGVTLLVRDGESERWAINQRAQQLLGQDGASSGALLEELQSHAVTYLANSADELTAWEGYWLRGWADGSHCLPTKWVERARALAMRVGRPLTPDDEALLVRTRQYRQRAGSQLLAEASQGLLAVLEDYGAAHDLLQTEAGTFHVRTIAAYERELPADVVHTALNRVRSTS